LAERRYLNYMSEDDVGLAPAKAGYGPNRERLAEVKRTYDPENFFHLNLNVEPSA
jgi:hypothetical protein